MRIWIGFNDNPTLGISFLGIPFIYLMISMDYRQHTTSCFRYMSSGLQTFLSAIQGMKRCVWLILVMISLGLNVSKAQDQTKSNEWNLSGYVKNLQTGILIDNPQLFFATNLLHNRLNFTWYYDQNTSLRVDLRNRFFWGDQVRLTANFLETLTMRDELLDFSWGFEDQRGFAGHSQIDRMYLEIIRGQLEIRVGKQRVNWGISTVWNPNDLFNAFSFSDFDYEERPGSDALRVKYYTGYAGSVEVVMMAARNIRESVGAFMWRFNRWNYDFQILMGFRHVDYAFGTGWAGNLGNAGFKGELALFVPMEDFVPLKDEDKSFSATLAVDYAFSNSLYMNNGFLYNSQGNDEIDITQLFDFEPSAKNLYPYKYSIFTQWAYPFTELLSGNIALIYSPSKTHGLFLVPTLAYSMADNWDADLIGQIVFQKFDQKFESPLQAVFLRVKFSF